MKLTDSEANARKYAFMLLTTGAGVKGLQERLEKRGFAARHISGTLKRLKEAGYLMTQAWPWT